MTEQNATTTEQATRPAPAVSGGIDMSHATPALFAALAKAQAEVENADKNSNNPHFRTKYADLAEVLNTVRPLYASHGLSMLQSTGFDGRLVHVTTVLAHAEGGYISSTASCVPAKTDAQGIGAATTYLRRYGLSAMTGVAQEDDDGNAAGHQGKPAATDQAGGNGNGSGKARPNGASSKPVEVKPGSTAPLDEIAPPAPAMGEADVKEVYQAAKKAGLSKMGDIRALVLNVTGAPTLEVAPAGSKAAILDALSKLA